MDEFELGYDVIVFQPSHYEIRAHPLRGGNFSYKRDSWRPAKRAAFQRLKAMLDLSGDINPFSGGKVMRLTQEEFDALRFGGE